MSFDLRKLRVTDGVVKLDNYMPAVLFDMVRDEAAKAKYGPIVVGDHQYEGYSECPPAIYEIFGNALYQDFGVRSFNKLAFKWEHEDHSTNSWIHADNSLDEFAFVYYISQPPPGTLNGTAFWRHKKLESRIWQPAAYGAAGEFAARLVAGCSEDESQWNLDSVVSFVPNRLVLYPARVFHSRFPKWAWGPDDQTRVLEGRSLIVGFFS